MITAKETLAEIHALRVKLNDVPMSADFSNDWANRVLYLLAQAIDVLENPTEENAKLWGLQMIMTKSTKEATNG